MTFIEGLISTDDCESSYWRVFNPTIEFDNLSSHQQETNKQRHYFAKKGSRP